MPALTLRCVDSGLEIPGIVQRIKNSYDIYSVCYGFLYEIGYYIVGVMTVSENILTAEEHLQLCILYRFADNAEALPRILAEKAQACVKGGSSPCLERIVPDLIHIAQNGQHILGGHPCGYKGLVCVAQAGLANLYLFILCHGIDSFLKFTYFPKVARSTPAATAEPITPATFGPIAFMSRKFEGSSF